jgi:hypothetical protein
MPQGTPAAIALMYDIALTIFEPTAKVMGG